ncbi:type 4a pilus biogenesis protein PilO [Alkalihalobacillus trypoxylicola]|uniref:Pilus assembly protein PilO n=1 Tax=Alkalihalobacillus trypoxylicola TaxID=519424 RepID=A0A161PGG5_9BACI|nr:type 4a pilus biogenesis protein PilO [Alkalihalobacillus trypoxylicola]KYG32307.1 hypothetical protein AZF04_05955 [Alkalihalobacillus trypoxylicola]
MKIYWSKKRIIYLLFFFSLLVLFHFFVYQTSVSSKREQVKILAEQISVEKEAIAVISKELENMEGEKAHNLQEMANRIPVQPEQEHLSMEINELMELLDVDISSVVLQSNELNFNAGFSTELNSDNGENDETISTSLEGLQSYQLEMTVFLPDYQNFIDLIEGIQRLERITSIENITLESIESANDSLKCTLLLSTYYYPAAELVYPHNTEQNYPFLEGAHSSNPF